MVVSKGLTSTIVNVPTPIPAQTVTVMLETAYAE